MRFFTEITRDALQGDTLRGYAAVYESPTTAPVRLGEEQLPAGAEVIARGAFDGLTAHPVVITVDHDMARSFGFARVWSDEHGLGFEAPLDSDLGRQVRRMVDAGDLAGMSFTATPGEIVRAAGRVVHRSFAALKEIAVVRRPAYGATVVRDAAPVPAGVLVRARHRVRTEGKASD